MFYELVQGVHTEHKVCMMESISIPNIIRDNMKTSLYKECKEASARCAQSSAKS
jgi:hypothetical protein